MITTDICIIGAGPVGLFAVFEAGLLKLRCHVVDYLPQVGGQLSEIYPKKPIYDIPGFPTILAQELVDNLMQQIEPFKPTFTLGERIENFEKQEDGSFLIHTHLGSKIHAKVLCIAGGLGCFEPRKPEVANIDEFEDRGINYIIRDPEVYRDKKVVLAGGGDSALDWTIYLADIAADVTLIHRTSSFRAAPDSVGKVMKLSEEGKVKLLLNTEIKGVSGNGKLNAVELKSHETLIKIETDYLIPLFGLSPKLGPIEHWGLNLDKNAIEVNTKDFETNVSGIYAIGDINTYPGKLKLILCGFHEAALMSHGAFKHIFPDKKYTMKYTTVQGITGF
jgi:thioredoxin reductase (NADPH)